MRVSSFNVYNNTSYYLNQLDETMSQQEKQISTGKSILRGSDNPLGSNEILVYQDALSKINDFESNIGDARSMLTTISSTVQNAQQITTDVRNLTLQAANGTNSQTDLNIIATSIEGYIQQIVNLGNTKLDNNYLFSGQKITTQPFTYTAGSSTFTYNGDNNQMGITTGQGITNKVTQDGSTNFSNVISALISVRNAIQSGNTTTMNNSIATLDTASTSMETSLTTAGTQIKNLNFLENNYSTIKLDLQTKIGNMQNVDYAKVMSDYNESQKLYQGSIYVASKMSSISILDYMR